MKCNYKPKKLSKEEQQELASLKSTLPYIDRMQIEKRNWCEVDNNQEEKENTEKVYFIPDRVQIT